MEFLWGAFQVSSWACGLALLLPCAFFFLECVSAVWRTRGAAFPPAALVRTTVLIPAQDEAAVIAATLEAVQRAAFTEMDVLVVADNCADATAEVARACGVRVVERSHAAERGKDFAIAFGLETLRAQPPDVVIVLDADCVVAPDALRQLAACAHFYARPVQAAYVLNPLPDAAPRIALATFAFRVKNVVRPLGLRRWGAPCLLTGSGMAFPWHTTQRLSAVGHLSEDMWWSVALTCAGYAPLFCSDAFVYSESPRREAILKTQRARWERGHLATMRAGIPKLLRAAILERRAEPLWLALELSVPPLTLLVCGAVLFCAVAGVWFAASKSMLLFALAFLNLILLGAALVLAWWKFGRVDFPARLLRAVPGYLVWKFPLYLQMLRCRRVTWTRTAREPSAPGES
jgi:cellulose synthase/poly-beta-1,6-N-acetylglucosamine synthase-like glycosyltransferase